MRCVILSILLSTLRSLSMAQGNIHSEHQSNDFKIKIIDYSIKIDQTSPEFELTIELTNNTENNLLLYGFDSNQISTTRIDRLCDVERIGAGVAIILYNSVGKVQFPNKLIPDSLKYKPISDSLFRQRTKAASERYLTGTRISKKEEIVVLKRKISLWRYSVQPGMFRLKLIYFCGKGIFDSNVVGKERVEVDKRNADAEVLFGCTTSNEVILNVN